MVIIYFMEEGAVTSTQPIKKPEEKNMEALVSAFENLRKKGRSYYFGFENVSPREQAVWNMADKMAKLKIYCVALEKNNLLLRTMLCRQAAKQLPYFLSGSCAKRFAKIINKHKCRVEILDDKSLEIFDGEKVEIVPISNKQGNDMLKDK